MKSFKILAISILLFYVNKNFGQDIRKSQITQEPHIEVSASSELEFYPDEIFVGITIGEKFENKVKVNLEEQLRIFYIILKDLNIGEENLKHSDPNALFADINLSKNESLLKREFVLKVSDVLMVTKLFFELQKKGFSDVGIVKVGHSKEDSLLVEVKRMAIRKAKDKASLFLNAIDQQIGEPLEIKETEEVYSDIRKSIRNTRSSDSKNYADGKKISSLDGNEIKLPKLLMKTTVNLKYSIIKRQ